MSGLAHTVVITGGNSGIGFETARAVLAQDASATVVVAGRHRDRVSKAAARLDRRRATARVLDLASLASVAAFASSLKADLELGNLPPLSALVCNAGVQVIGPARFTVDGHEETFAVNHLGHFALTMALLDSLVECARIVVVSSDTHDPAQKTGMPRPRYIDARKLAAAEVPADSDGSALKVGRIRYTTSKLCNLLFVYELDRRLRAGEFGDHRITVNAFNPGLTPGTGLARTYPAPLRFAFRYVLPIVARLTGRMKTPAEQGQALAYLLLEDELEIVSGAYFSGRQQVHSSLESQDNEKARDLWDTSEELIKPDRWALF